MNKIILVLAVILLAIPMLAQHCGSCPSQIEATTVSATSNASLAIAKAKTPHWLNKDYYVSYQWDKSPKIGNFVLLVNVFDKNKKPVKNLNVTANAYMPSMKGSHDTGDKKMQLNKKNQYAIPVYFMMLGEWEVELKFTQGKTLISSAIVKQNIK